MTNLQTRLAWMNSIFADRLGRIPSGKFSGEARFQLKQAKDLMIPQRVDTEIVESPGGLALVVPTYQWGHQFSAEDERWCIAKWQPPIPPDEWSEKYGHAIGWPADGYFFLFQPLNYVPDEDWATWAADHLDWQGSTDYITSLNRTQENFARREAAYGAQVRDIFHDSGGSLQHLPGKRGGSYLAFNESNKG